MSINDFERVLGLHAALAGSIEGNGLQPSWSLQGLGALSLLEARMAALTGDAKWKRSAHETLTRSFDLLTDANGYSIGLHSGVSGLGWVTRLVNRSLPPADRFDVSDLDDLVFDYLSSPDAWDGGFDVIDGVAGCAVYVFEQPDPHRRAEMLDACVRLLSTRAEADASGIWWKTPPWLLPDWQRASHPDGCYNTGLAHGLPSVVAVLARIATGRIESPDLMRLLDGSVAACLSTLSHEPRSEREIVGYTRGDGAAARCAWCYGEPGCAVALAEAGKAQGDRSLRDRARALFRSSFSRPDPSTRGLYDVGLCHGWSGLHATCSYFASLVPGESSGMDSIASECLLEMRAACDASLVHGLLPLFEPMRPEGAQRDPGFLNGALGLAHALLDSAFPHAGDVDLPWADCMFL